MSRIWGRDNAVELDIQGLFWKSSRTMRQHPVETIAGGIVPLIPCALAVVVVLAIASFVFGHFFSADLLARANLSSVSVALLIAGFVFAIFAIIVHALFSFANCASTLVWLALLRNGEFKRDDLDFLKDRGSAAFGAGLLKSILLAIAASFCLIPAILISPRLCLYGLVALDHEVSAVEALRGSWELTAEESQTIGITVSLLALLNFVGALFFGFGLFYTIPFSQGVLAALYEKIAIPGDFGAPEVGILTGDL